MDPLITSDLRKYRGYQGNSVRDLLRALRNKVLKYILPVSLCAHLHKFFCHFTKLKKKQKHHYHELTLEMQMKMGALPNQFTQYWIDRFPRLLSHSYHSLVSCYHEHLFKAYYTKKFVFSKPNYFYENTDDFLPPEQPPKIQRDSPKRYTKDFRFKQNDNGNTATINIKYGKPYGENNSAKPNKKGAYNFHRNNLANNNELIERRTNEGGTSSDFNESVDTDGFTKVRYRGIQNNSTNCNVNLKKRVEGRNTNNQTENILWTLPNREDNK